MQKYFKINNFFKSRNLEKPGKNNWPDN